MENTSKQEVYTRKAPAKSASAKFMGAFQSGGDEGSRTPVFRPFGGNVYTLSRPIGFRFSLGRRRPGIPIRVPFFGFAGVRTSSKFYLLF